MRLRALHTGQTFLVKAKLALIRAVSGFPAPDVLRALHYKQKRFGEPFSDLLQAVMRGDSDWTIGERELFAAFVSQHNRCRF